MVTLLNRVLVADDEPTTAAYIAAGLRRAGYHVETTEDGRAALRALETGSYGTLVTDWMMPGLSGIDLVREVRTGIRPAPLIVMVTALDTDKGRSVAMMAGADEFVGKPVDIDELVLRMSTALARASTPLPLATPKVEAPEGLPPHVAVLLVAGTGGPAALVPLIRDLPARPQVCVLVAQHGPPWLQKQLAARIMRETGRRAHYCEGPTPLRGGEVLLAPADSLVQIEAGEVWTMRPERPGRPADHLLSVAAAMYGGFCAAAILTGIGREGASGAQRVADAGGLVLIQDPETALADEMPRAARGVAHEVLPLGGIAPRLSDQLEQLMWRLE